MQRRLPLQIRRRLSRAVVVSFGLLLVFSSFSIWLLMARFSSQTSAAKVLAAASRQRMLTQRISKLALWMISHPEDDAAASALATNVWQWHNVQAGLLYGDQTLGLTSATQPELKQLLTQGLRQMNRLQLVTIRIQSRYISSQDRQKLGYQLLGEDEACLAVADKTVDYLSRERDRDLNILALMFYATMGGTLLLVAGGSVFVFRRAIQQTAYLIERLALSIKRQRRFIRRLRSRNVQRDEELIKLAESEEHYRGLVENSRDLIYEARFDGTFIYASRSVVEILGIQNEPLEKLGYMPFVRHDYREALAEYYRRSILDKQVSTYFEFPILSRRGTEHWLGQTGNAIFDAEGRVDRFQFIARDLTEERRIQLQSEEQKSMLTAILESSKDSISVLDVYRDITGEPLTLKWAMANPAANRLFGVDSLLGRQFLDVMPIQQASSLLAWCKEGLESSYMRERESQLTLNGEERMLRISSVSLPEGLVLTFTDITAEKLARQELQSQKNFYETILNHMPSEVVVFSPDHRYLFLNPAAVRSPEMRHWLQGKTDEEYASYKGHYHDKALQRRSHFLEALETRKDIQWEDVFVRPDGTESTYLRGFSPIENSDGEIYIVVGNGIDITGLKQIEADLQRARLVAEESAQARQMFINSMSHEMRTPLNCIIGLSQLLLEENPRPDQAEDLRAMLFSSKNLLALINDVLDFGKLEAGKVGLEHIPFQLQELLQGIHSTFRHQALEKKIDLGLMLSPDLPIQVISDPIRLTQVLTNLLSNALKFTSVGGVYLRVEAVRVQSGRAQLQFSVIDTGIGIPADKQQAIFETFTQATDDTTRLFGGTGLGLSITKQLLHLFGTEIELDSTPGKGSTFSFRLSLDLPEQNTQPGSSMMSIDMGEQPLSSLRILLAEDNEINRLVASKFLKKWGIVPDVAVDGREALEKVRANTYDILLMDIQMPVLDGLEASRQIRLLPHGSAEELPIIALTAFADDEIRQQVADAGMNAIATKPFNPPELYDLLLRFSNQSHDQAPRQAAA